MVFFWVAEVGDKKPAAERGSKGAVNAAPHSPSKNLRFDGMMEGGIQTNPSHLQADPGSWLRFAWCNQLTTSQSGKCS